MLSPQRTVYILSDLLDDQLRALWYPPFQSDDMETDQDMVRVCFIWCSILLYKTIAIILVHLYYVRKEAVAIRGQNRFPADLLGDE